MTAPMNLRATALHLAPGGLQQVGRATPAANDLSPGMRAMERELQAMANTIKAASAAKSRAAAAARPAAPVRVIAATVATEAEYRAALAAHDWFYDRSEDHATWAAGINSLGRVQAMRKRLDPTGAIWNSVAPAEFRIAERKPLHANVYCSQCAGQFGPGDNGYSHCADHRAAVGVGA